MSLLLLGITSNAWSCPEIGRLVDFNCNQEIKITITGDSIVSGTGDIIPKKIGGYPFRLRKRLPEARVISLGFPGISTGRMLRLYIKDLKNKKSQIYKKTHDADIIIIDVGRNDYWLRQPATTAVRNIRRLVFLIEESLTYKKVKPFIVVSTLVRTGRSWQQPFVDSINSQLRFLKASSDFPVYLDFASVPAELSSDGIHPTPEGYNKLTKHVARWIIRKSRYLMRSERPDRDSDGIYDIFEDGRKFDTSSSLYDSDNDTYSDGDEIFYIKSDPLDPLDPPLPEPSPEPTPEEEITPTPEPTPTLEPTLEPTPTVEP